VIILLPSSAGEITIVEAGTDSSCKDRPGIVRISFEPEGTGFAGCKVIVIRTPASNATYLDKVICEKDLSDASIWEIELAYSRPIKA
jgi:hypothetical protein